MPAPSAHRLSSHPERRCALARRGWPAASPAIALALALAATSAAAQGQAPSTAAAAETALDLGTFVQQIRSVNRAIKSKQAERDITATGVDRANSAFQPVLSLSTQGGRTRQANTREEDLIRQNLGIYDRTGNDYALGVTQVLPSGAKVEGKVTMSRFLTNIKQNQYPDEGPDYRGFFGVTFTQPLMRDFGVDVTRARLRVAELDSAAAGAASRDTESSVVAEAIFAYWDLLMAQRRAESAQERLTMGNRLLAEARSLSRQGRLADSEVTEVENNRSRFEAGLSEARMAVHERANRLRTLLMAAGGKSAGALRLTQPLPDISPAAVSFERALQTAREKRDDLRMRKLAIEREDIQLDYARNQALPRIDFVASYGQNGLGAKDAQALRWQPEYPSWTVGVQFSVPLGKNLQGQADVQAARLRRDDAALQLQALETAVANDIDTGLSMLESTAERWKLWTEVARREQQQLEQERRRLAAGRSDMREILLREERAIHARLAVVEQQVAWAKAQVLLDAAQGTLLERFQ